MSEPAGTRRTSPSPRPAKRPYVKPAFRSERVFETMALGCGKSPSTEGQCQHVIKHS